VAKKLPSNPRDHYVHTNVSLEELAELYAGQKSCSLSTLTRRCGKEKWPLQREQNESVVNARTDAIITRERASESAAIISKLEQLKDVTLEVHLEFMNNLKGQIKDIQNPFLFDGERTNSLFQTAMNNSVKVVMAAMKAQEEDDDGKELTPPDEIKTPEQAMENIKSITRE
jgi:hypothetical protein